MDASNRRKEAVFDALPFTDISEERLQWVLGMTDKNPQDWERSAEEQGKSTADAIRDDAEEIIEAASDAFQKSSAALAREHEDVTFRWRWIVGGAIADRRQERSASLGSPQGTEPPMEIRSFEPIWMPPTNIKGAECAKREMLHRGSLQPTCSKKD
uniref:Uncharacterized protein n=1 Tax=Parascaris univalens TaxID=6257 RepID=A0A915BV31_PARUN